MGLTELDRVELVIEERETNRRRLIAVEALGWPVEREALDTACALLKLSSLVSQACNPNVYPCNPQGYWNAGTPCYDTSCKSNYTSVWVR